MAKVCWSSLPEELWKLILVHVPLPERVGTCSRVSKKLCRATAAATQQLGLHLRGDEQRLEAFKRWLTHHGQHFTSLEVSRPGGALTQLPCQHLRQLCLTRCRVQLGPSSSQLGILHSCTGLTKLCLRSCKVINGLSLVPALQHVELVWIRGADTSEQLSLPGRVLKALTRLTLLKCAADLLEVTAESLQHISALQHLQVLQLNYFSLPLSPSSTPGLAALTGLHTLRLSAATLDPVVLQHYTQLQVLDLEDCALSGANSAAVLLSVIGQQLQLQELTLSMPYSELPTAAAAFTALTASSRLQNLQLCLGGLPPGVWQAVFSRRQQLPQLQSLSACSWTDDVPQGPAPADFSTGDIARLVDCCPGLQDAEIRLQPDVQLTALSQLTALTALTIFEANQTSVTSLSGLSQLKALNIYARSPCSASALLPLTASQQLTSLVMDLQMGADFGAQLDEDDAVENTGVILLRMSNQADDSAPDVWLLEHCASISSCQPTIIRGLVQQQQLTSSLQQLVGSLQQQVNTLQAQCFQQQQEMIQQQHIIEQLQATNAQQQLQHHAAGAAFGRRMAALEGQVAQLMEALQHRG